MERSSDDIVKLMREMMSAEAAARGGGDRSGGSGGGGGGARGNILPLEYDKAHLVQCHDAANRSMQAIPAGMFKSCLNLSRRDEPASLGDVASLAKYTPILIKDMVVGKVHRGRVLYGNLVATPFAMSSIMSVVEDHSGYAMRVTICVPDVFSLNDFPRGAKVAIKEPYLKTALDGNLGIRIDDGSRIVRIDDIGELVSLRMQGNAYYVREQWDEAIQSYTRCIARCLEVRDESRTLPKERVHEVLLPALSNRAEAYMKLKDYDKALCDSNAALVIDEAHLKSTYRKGRALLGLKSFADAEAWLQRALRLDPLISREILDALEAARAGLEQQQ